MNKPNFDKEFTGGESQLVDNRISLFIKGLQTYFAIVAFSFILLALYVLVFTQTRYGISFVWFLALSFLYLLYFTLITTKVPEISFSYKFWQLVKRFIDVVFASFLIFILLPVLILILIAIRLDSPGPVLIRSKHVGQFGKFFDSYKFRTMNIATNDKTITRLGRLLRRTSLDYLPNIYNVLEGTLSLVGPIPRLPKGMEILDSEHKILSVKPGMTGPWQISKSKSTYDELIKHELDYVENWSLLLDIKILFLTPLFVLSKND